jgi:polyhydroxybutyrate depolymerase
MKKLVFLIAFIGLAFTGTSQQTITATITHDGLQREYILYVPANYTGSAAVPLVFNFHGYTSNATEQMWYGDFRAIADTAGFIIVHPNGMLDGNGTTHFNVGWGGSTVDDVGFSAALLDSISADYNINADRVYSTGMSNGGFMSYHLACQLSDRIAAIASVTGSMSPVTYNACNPQHPTPILEIHGTADGTVPYTGASFSKPVSNVLNYWVNYNNSNSTPTVINIPDINTSDGSTVDHMIYYGGDNDVTVEHFKITGGGHTWSGSAFGGAGTNYDIDASVEVWKFFSKYDINGLIGGPTLAGSLNFNDEINIFPNPSAGKVSIQYRSSKAIAYELYSIQGTMLLNGVIEPLSREIDLSNLPQNVYILKMGSHSFKVFKL